MIPSITPLPITPEMIKAPKESSARFEERGSAESADSVPATSKPTHPDEVGQMVNVEA